MGFVIHNRPSTSLVKFLWSYAESHCILDYPLTCVQVKDEAVKHVKLRELVHNNPIPLKHPTGWSPSQHVGESGIITVSICSK